MLCAIVRKTVKFLASAVCMGKPVWFFVNVKVCAPIMVIGVGNRQMENDLKKDYTGAFKNDKNYNSEYYFIIQKRSKSIDDARNESTDLILARNYVSQQYIH